MASAGLTVKDLHGPALDRLAIKDGRSLLLIDGLPPHPRASEAKALVADSLKSDAYRVTFDRQTAELTTPDAGRQSATPARTVSEEIPDQRRAPAAMSDATPGGKAPPSADRPAADINSMRSEGDTADKRRAIPTLEERFKLQRQAGRVGREGISFQRPGKQGSLHRQIHEHQHG